MLKAVCSTCGVSAAVTEAGGAIAVSWGEGARNACQALKHEPKIAHLNQCPSMIAALSGALGRG